MKSHQFPGRFLLMQGLMIACYSLLTSFLILLYKTQPDQCFLSRISSFRLIAAALPFSAALLAAFFVHKSLTKRDSIHYLVEYLRTHPLRLAILQKFAVLAGIAGLTGFFLPYYHFDDFAEYYVRLQ